MMVVACEIPRIDAPSPSPSEREVHRRTPARVLCPPVRQGGGTPAPKTKPQRQRRNCGVDSFHDFRGNEAKAAKECTQRV